VIPSLTPMPLSVEQLRHHATEYVPFFQHHRVAAAGHHCETLCLSKRPGELRDLAYPRLYLEAA
jgi:hypothetical protein